MCFYTQLGNGFILNKLIEENNRGLKISIGILFTSYNNTIPIIWCICSIGNPTTWIIDAYCG